MYPIIQGIHQFLSHIGQGEQGRVGEPVTLGERELVLVLPFREG